MKNVINYFYNLIPDEIHYHDDQYYFNVNNIYYLFLPCHDNISNIVSIYNYLKKTKIYCLEIINNKNHQIFTIINDKKYMLLKDYSTNRRINIYDIINYSTYIDIKENVDWYNKWIDKLDYYEYQMDQYENQYPILYESFFYYDGLTELAISLLNTVDLKKVKMFISHHRINNKSTLRNLYNPISMIIDTRVRDIAEFYKYSFFHNNLFVQDVDRYITSEFLSYEEKFLFFIRMIYPSYYFDLYDEIIMGKEEEQKIYMIINQNKKYELLLKHIYKTLKSSYDIPEIEWLLNN